MKMIKIAVINLLNRLNQIKKIIKRIDKIEENCFWIKLNKKFILLCITIMTRKKYYKVS